MGKWAWSSAAYSGGVIQLVVHKLLPGGIVKDITFLRGVPTQIQSWSDADPFGDTSLVFQLPKVTPWDDLKAPDLAAWLDYNSNVDLYWVPVIAAAAQYSALPRVTNPLTEKADAVAPAQLLDGDGHPVGGDTRLKLWEGFIADLGFTDDGQASMLEVQCQGALFQSDAMYARPFFPARPWPYENLIADVFDPARRPSLRNKPMLIAWPTGWIGKVPPYSTINLYTPNAKPGVRWTGFAARQTGAWDHAVTGFVQELLNVMVTNPGQGGPPNGQWTVRHLHTGQTVPTGAVAVGTDGAGAAPGTVSTGRQPVMVVRAPQFAADFSLWLGQPGVTVSLTGDSTQSENVIYGSGTGLDGTQWRNAVIANDGSRTDYLPLAADRAVWPPETAQPGGFVREAFQQFGVGFDQPTAVNVAKGQLARDRAPGWVGTITLKTDPSPLLPRWAVRAGMKVRLKGFLGTGDAGVFFSIASTEKNLTDASVTLTVDSRARDLLTVDESRSRARDPLTPVKMLQAGRASLLLEDQQAPWDYTAGSGFITTAAKDFHAQRPATVLYPYVAWTAKFPPQHYPSFYVRIPANQPQDLRRWAGPIPILTSERGSISRSEFVLVDILGRPMRIPFHVSIYDINVIADTMPHLNGSYSPYQNNAFEDVDPSTGINVNPLLKRPPSLRIAWGNQSGGVLNRAGFWPGRESAGAAATGLLVDESTWQYDNTQGKSAYFLADNHLPGARPPTSDVSLYLMAYAEHPEPVYLLGRLFRQNPGTG